MGVRLASGRAPFLTTASFRGVFLGAHSGRVRSGGKGSLVAKAKESVAIALGVVFSLMSAFHAVGAFGAWDNLPVLPVMPGAPTPQASTISWLFVAAAFGVVTEQMNHSSREGPVAIALFQAV